jgi:hypothetical protein
MDHMCTHMPGVVLPARVVIPAGQACVSCEVTRTPSSDDTFMGGGHAHVPYSPVVIGVEVVAVIVGEQPRIRAELGGRWAA